MAPALSTTKRKFDRILESISNPSTSPSRALHHDSNASSNSNPFSNIADFRAAKRFRYTESMSPSPSIVKSSPSKELGKTVEGGKIHELPNFAPYDRELFLKRLETFRDVDKWMSKPTLINEVEWAKRGWTCVGKDKVGCVGGCGAEVMIILENDRPLEKDTSLENDKSPETDRLLENENALENAKSKENGQSLENDEALEENKGKLMDEDKNTKLDGYEPWLESAKRELVEKYRGMIVSEHEEGCMWRRRGCDGTHFSMFPFIHHQLEPISAKERIDRYDPPDPFRPPSNHLQLPPPALRVSRRHGHGPSIQRFSSAKFRLAENPGTGHLRLAEDRHHRLYTSTTRKHNQPLSYKPNFPEPSGPHPLPLRLAT